MIDPVSTGIISGFVTAILGKPLSKLSYRAVFFLCFFLVATFFIGFDAINSIVHSRRMLLFTDMGYDTIIVFAFIITMSIFFGILGVMVKSLVPPETIDELREMCRDGFRTEIVDNGSMEIFSQGDLKITATLDEENRRYEVVRYKGKRRLDRYFVRAD